MMYTGEFISLIVAFSWTATALFAEVASRRIGSLPLNVVRMTMSLVLLALTLWLTLGVPYPLFADGKTWLWLCLSGFVGYVLGDYCLFQSYILIGSRFGQLLMTLSAPSAALAAWILLGEALTPLALLGMLVTLTGIGISVLNKGGEDENGKRRKLKLKLPLKGVIMGVCAGMGQGVGLVLSKVGMGHYESAIAAQGIADMASYVSPEATVPVSLGMMMPFASTMIRAIMGFVGFTIALLVFTHKGSKRLNTAVHDQKAMLFTFGATMFGPFIGVSLSLMATLYTNAGIAQTIMALTPVFILAPAYFFLHQKVTVREVAGAVISIVGVCLFFI